MGFEIIFWFYLGSEGPRGLIGPQGERGLPGNKIKYNVNSVFL